MNPKSKNDIAIDRDTEFQAIRQLLQQTEDDAVRDAVQRITEQAIANALTRRQREVVTMHYSLGMKPKEIAAALRISKQAARYLLKRGNARLRQVLAPMMELRDAVLNGDEDIE